MTREMVEPGGDRARADLPAVAARPVALDGTVGTRRRENFPVASRLLPRRMRRHLLAVYDYCRLVDDVGDEARGDRLAQLDWLDDEVDRAFAESRGEGGRATHPVLVRLVPTITSCDLSSEPFHRLVEANRRDQHVDRYASWEALREYCTFSAHPVGRLVLAVFGVSTPQRVGWSDDVCTGLQLVEHLQDVAEDRREKRRVYLPADTLARHGVTDANLDAPTAAPALRSAVASEVLRARGLLASGVHLAASLRGSARLAVCGFTGGGLATLDALDVARHDVLGTVARPTRRRTASRSFEVLRAARTQARASRDVDVRGSAA